MFTLGIAGGLRVHRGLGMHANRPAFARKRVPSFNFLVALVNGYYWLWNRLLRLNNFPWLPRSRFQLRAIITLKIAAI